MHEHTHTHTNKPWNQFKLELYQQIFFNKFFQNN